MVARPPMGIVDTLLESPLGYALWSAPLNVQKVASLERVLPDLHGKKVLDVGCGPGSNTECFNGCDYTGIDLNPAYIADASARFPGRTFLVQNAHELELNGQQFDLVLINSLLHHLNDEMARQLFRRVGELLAPSGVVILAEPLIPPPGAPFPRLMQRMDRGDHFRTYEQYLALFQDLFVVEEEDAYALKYLGMTGWHMRTLRLVKSGRV